MKEIPVLFSTMMVQANLNDLKTNTRRTRGLNVVNKNPDKWNLIEVDSPFKPADIYWFEGEGERIAVKCPYGQTGDLLWVRESFQWMEGFAGSGYYVFKADFSLKHGEWQKVVSNKFHDVEVVRIWKPSIFMPKEAARIWLQVESTRVERLQDITPNDVCAEGVGEKFRSCATSMTSAGIDHNRWCSKQIKSFKDLWKVINGPQSWELNPWLWVIKYNVLSKNGKPDINTLKAKA